MEYLVKEGFKDAVAAFEEESGINPGVNMSMLDDQIKIRDAVEAGIAACLLLTVWTLYCRVELMRTLFILSLSSGSIQEAVELVNDVDPEILDTNSTLFFHLQQQQLLELIKQVHMESEDAMHLFHTDVLCFRVTLRRCWSLHRVSCQQGARKMLSFWKNWSSLSLFWHLKTPPLALTQTS